MDAAIISREEIIALAEQDAREWIAGGCKAVPQNRFAALTREAKLYDVALRRAMGSDDEEGEA